MEDSKLEFTPYTKTHNKLGSSMWHTSFSPIKAIVSHKEHKLSTTATSTMAL
jgi:hypothetical protein